MKRAKAAKSACAAGDAAQVDHRLSHKQSQSECGYRKEVAALLVQNGGTGGAAPRPA